VPPQCRKKCDLHENFKIAVLGMLWCLLACCYECTILIIPLNPLHFETDASIEG
jgi:hypothetical protein